MATAGKTTLEIAAGNWRAGVRPGAGGALASLSHRDNDVLRPMPADSLNPLDAACFPLVPYCNRIRRGRFAFGGHNVSLAANHPPERHSLHGLGWQRPWHVSGLVGASIELVCDHGGEGWPWPWRATQAFELDERGLTLTLTLTNTGRETMPAGIGLHPYFRRWRDSRARFEARAVVLSDIEQLPTGEMEDADNFADWARGAPIPSFTVDNCYARWDGEVTITDGLGTIFMQAEGARHLHVYAAGNGRDLCFEPVNHLPDAVNRDDWTMPVLEPGESARVTMRIEER
ncbi:MAG: aldose 1-epimerase [Sphingomonadales bacterium]|nr:aldose 1-epimerase [Sphingomonadales bacterium]